TITATIPISFIPTKLALSGDESKVLAISRYNNTVPIIDTAINTVVATLTPGGGTYVDIATSPTAPRAFLGNAAANRIDVIDTAGNAVIGSVALTAAPTSVTVSPDGTRVFAVQGTAGIITVIDTPSLTVSATLSVPVGFNGLRQPVAGPNGRLYVP